MRGSWLVLGAALVAIAHCAVIPTKVQRRVADESFLIKQKKVLDFFVGIGNDGDEFTSEYDDFNFKDKTLYTKSEVVQKFYNMYKLGTLSQDGVFTMNCPKIRYETYRLFDLFYYAKNFDILHKLAFWARKHMHSHQVAYAYSVAIYHREDTQGIVIPPLYEVFPHYYVNSNVIHHMYKTNILGIKNMKYDFNNTGYEYTDMGFYGVDATGNKWTNDFEHRISYFREDVGLNSFYASWFLKFPTWFEQTKYPEVSFYKLGELFYYLHQQLFAHYSLERIANNLPSVDILEWETPIKTGYNPNMVDDMGRSFVARPDYVTPKELNSYGTWYTTNFERRLVDAIDAGLLFENKNSTYIKLDEEYGMDYLGQAVYGTGNSVGNTYYGSYYYSALKALSEVVKSSNSYEYTESVLGKHHTVLRDPAYYYFLHRMIKLFDRYNYYLKPYQADKLAFDGVKVKNFEVDKLVTYFDKFEFELSNGVPAIKDHDDYHYYGRQTRINHKPFSYKLTVQSDKNIDAMVRVFIGPKHDADGKELTVEQARLSYVQLDKYPVKLTAGQNSFERQSHEFFGYTDDQESFSTYYKKVKTAIDNKEPFYYTEKTQCGLPERFQLPKGWKDGNEYKMYVVVTPYHQVEKINNYHTPCGALEYYDGLPLGFPFDRKVTLDYYKFPNMYFKDVLVYHKEGIQMPKME